MDGIRHAGLALAAAEYLTRTSEYGIRLVFAIADRQQEKLTDSQVVVSYGQD